MSDFESVALAREAAERLFDSGSSDGEDTYEPVDVQTAQAAVLRLEELFAGLPRVIAEALDGARSSGEVLSGERLQGLGEILQNADDANASEVRFELRENDLLMGHNGEYVRLRHVLGLATPWFSTKGRDAKSFGRFGIGLSALRAISRTIDVHCSPYHVRLGDPTLSPIKPIELPTTFDGEEWTVFRVPFGEENVELGDLSEWLDHWGDGGLLFLRHVSEVVLRGSTEEEVRRISVRREAAGSSQVAETPSRIVDRPQMVKAPGNLSWMVYTAKVATPTGVSRVRKAKEPTTPIGVALPLHEVLVGQVYAGLPVVETPLPVFVNAQFDPLTSRRDLADTAWNRALVPLVADIWAHAAVDLFRRNPVAAWGAMPVESLADEKAVSSLLGGLNRAILDKARSSVADRVAFKVRGEGLLRLGELAVESKLLEGIVTEEETASLLGVRATLPFRARDAGVRWRAVLEDWHTSGADFAEPLSVEHALDLLRSEARPVRSHIALVAAGLREGLGDRLARLPCVVTSGGRRLVPPSADSAEAVAESVSPLAEELRIVTALHAAHLENTDDAIMVMEWLRERGALLDGTDDRVVVRRLAAAGRSGRRLEQPLTDGQVDALRRAFEMIDVSERLELGQDVGRAIALSAYNYEPHGARRRRWVSAAPSNAYLPRSIDGGSDTFSVAAAKSPGIVWLDGRYGRKLKSSRGRAGVGARRLLTLFGAETAPRPRPHPELTERYYSQRPGLAKLAKDSPSGRSMAMEEQGATYTLSDWECPAMKAAVEDIARISQGRRRRIRAGALLATLGRAWGRLADFAEVVTADDYYGWQTKGETPAFWVWQAREIAWLDDESGRPRRPSELRIRTPGTEAIFGADSTDFIHPDILGGRPDRQNLQAAMSVLGLSGDPTRRELVARLRAIKGIGSVQTIGRDAAIIYKALAESLRDTASRSDLSKRELRKLFDEGDGLIATKLGWQPRNKVFAGPAVFGENMPFAPQVPETDELWKALRLRKPLLGDCIKVLRRIARGRRSLKLEDEAVQLETLRLLVERYGASIRPQDRRRLRKLPLWTTQGWKRERPVFAMQDESLLDALGNRLPLWRPGGELEQFQSLLEPLRIEVIESADAEILDAECFFEAPETTHLFRAAVQQLQEDLVRNEPSAAQGLRCRWDELRELEVWSHPRLALAVHVPDSAGGGTQHCPVHVKVDADARKVFVRDPQVDLSRADRGGWAIAALFEGERRRVAQSWGAAWVRAKDGVMAARLELAQQKAEREKEEIGAEIDRQLEALRTRTGRRRRSTGGSQGRGTAVSDNIDRGDKWRGAAGGTRHRVLVDPNMLRVVNRSGQVVGESSRNAVTTARRTGGLVQPSETRSRSPRGRTPLRGYSDLERETVGLELVRKVLSSDHEDIVDLRTQRGVGADAMDELEQFYELKVSAGGEPDEVTLSNAEWQRAKISPSFFLVLVSGVEGAGSRPSVRIIPRPLDQLKQRVSGNIRLSGVRHAKSVTYRFEHVEGVPSGKDTEPEANA